MITTSHTAQKGTPPVTHRVAPIVPSPAPVIPPKWSVEPVREGLHRVLEGDVVVGFVEEAGIVQVALSGPVLAFACEVGQSLDFDAAVRTVRRASREQ